VAAELTDIMESVVTDGTGKLSQVAGYTVAGKTGTAQKVVNRHYSTTDYNVSFVGFVPSRKPEFTIVVVVDSPHKLPPYGGSVSAPIFKQIAEAALRYRGVAPTINPEPPILVARHDNLHEAAVSASADKPAIVTLVTASTGGAVAYPDLTGWSARDALSALARLGVSARIIGSGLVVEQEPPVGTPLDSAGTVTLRLQRRSAAHLTSTTSE
jgi:membrane peptidoglycan carboxypeptidase